jgi:DNA-binding LacI/PurR family transcriptional regulator
MVARVTIHDVARTSGVSTTTVSNALTGRGRIAPTTRVRVLEVAERLGYAANPSARGLRIRRTGALGLFLPDQTFGLEYYMNLAIGAAAEALRHGLALTLIPGHLTRQIHVDGVVVADPALGDPALVRLAELQVPLVTCERALDPAVVEAGRVESDHTAATKELLDHLAINGARRIALLCPTGETAFGFDVRAAYINWCEAAGQEPVVHDVPFATEPEDVMRAVAQALSAVVHPDAIVSVPDGGAASALQEVLREGRSVPDDILVASYVESSSLRGLATPITAVDLAPREMGRRAVALLARLLEGEAARGTVELLPTRLISRGSTACAPQGKPEALPAL